MLLQHPLSPAGIGLGHVVFDQIFELIGISGGANYFNLYFLYLISVNSLGFFPYMFGGKKPDLADTQEFKNFKVQT